jgi:hypothetical protein
MSWAKRNSWGDTGAEVWGDFDLPNQTRFILQTGHLWVDAVSFSAGSTASCSLPDNVRRDTRFSAGAQRHPAEYAEWLFDIVTVAILIDLALLT